jgi:DNA repair protein RadC
MAEAVASVLYHPGVKDLPVDIRPRERLARAGPAALANEELLAIILRSGSRELNVIELARLVLERCGGLDALARASLPQLQSIKGLGEVKSAEIQAVFELSSRLTAPNPARKHRIHTPEDIWQLVGPELGRLEQEHLRLLVLDNKNQVQLNKDLYVGTVNSTNVRLAEVFREAIRQNGVAIILAHNHPSGDPTPSPEDIRLTRDLHQAGQLLNIEVLDHVVVGRGEGAFVSLKRSQLGFPANGKVRF